MAEPLSRRLYTAKFMGDDSHSWAVFAKGYAVPLVTGCTRAEARYHKERLIEMYREREGKA